ncbi:unnamed protein product [Rotaria sordida]|uniref:Uncharacterized protein n=1 Tax=Rotaria sordida TaxID=392033 RepID=A0A815I6A9_9BILA|nr:unnamed protein product [Rotaria sordida]
MPGQKLKFVTVGNISRRKYLVEEKQQSEEYLIRTVVFYVKDFAYETSQILYKVLLNHVSSLLQTIDVYQIIQIQTINNTKSYSIVIG